jgi:RsiW-degrading membrane proteinase PrsW (M82 family)
MPAASPYPGPGYPLIPQSGQAPIAPGYPLVPGTAAYPGAPPPGYAAFPPYPGALAYPYAWYRPPRPPGETYHKVLSIITLVATSLLLLGGLGGIGVMGLLALAGSGQDLSVMNLIVMGTLAALVGGGAGLYHAIRALMRRASAPFSLPSYWILLALTMITLGAGIALFALNQPTGPLALVEPLVLLSGIVPALTVLALALRPLESQVSWRRAWLALTSGATLSIAAASLLELLLALALLGVASLSIDPTTFNPNGPSGVAALLVLIAVIAPLVEETVKQISGFFLLPRIKGPQEAFLIGLASGIGFAILETAGYIGTAQADWAGIALGRVGAGLLHGMGAAMAGVGWYYLVKGKGVPRRWRIGIGFLAYAYVQHAVFNGGQEALLLIFKPLQTWHFSFFDLQLDATILYAGALYLIILGIMFLVLRWLRQSAPSAGSRLDASKPAPNLAAAALSGSPGANRVGGPMADTATSDPPGIGDPGRKEAGGLV